MNSIAPNLLYVHVLTTEGQASRLLLRNLGSAAVDEEVQERRHRAHNNRHNARRHKQHAQHHLGRLAAHELRARQQAQQHALQRVEGAQGKDTVWTEDEQEERVDERNRGESSMDNVTNPLI